MFVATNKKNKSMGFNISGSSSKYGFKTIPNESVSWRLQSADGKYFGDVSYGAYKAVESGTLDSYKAKNEAEKKILDEVKSYIGWKEPEESKSLVITDYRPGTNNMSKNEYLRRQKSNPDMPEFGSYEYFKNREEYLRPIIDEIADDADRYNDTYKAWAENYAKDNTWAEGKPVQKLAKKLYEKFKYQDAILAEYKDIDAQLKKFDKKGIHYDNALEIDTESGAAEAKYAKERLDAIVNATTFTNDEMVLGVYGELPKDKQKEYDNVRVVAGKRNVEAEKEKAYNYYDKNKDNVYKDDLWGRITGNYKIGRISIKTNDAGYTSYKASTDDVEAAEVYQALSSRIQKQNNATFQNNGAAEEITAIVAQYAPQGVDQALYKAGGSLVGAVIGAASGAGAAATARAGGSAAVAGYMYRQTAGAAFVRLLQESNLSVKDAKTLANSEALASSAVEFGLDYVTSGLWKGVGSATKNATSELGEKTMKALMSKGISEKGAKTIISVAKNAGKLTVDALGEGTEEWIQEGMSITADKYAAEGKTASAFKLFTKSFDLTQYSKEDFSRMNQSFLAGTIIGFGHGGLNAATSLGINKTVSAAAGAVDAKVLGEEINKSGETKIITDAVEMAKDNVSPEVVRAVETVETAIAEDNTPPAEAVGTVVKSVLTDNAVQETAAETEHVKNEIEETPASVSVGDTFKDTKTGNTITVVERDAENTTVEISTGEKTETREFTNNQADTLVTNEQFEQMESSEVISPEDAQRYNIVVSNLKRKAEELGLLDTNFFNTLQNVNLYNPSASDRAAISSEFRRVFAGNTDPLVTDWLNAISVEAQPVTSINEQNMPVSSENTPVNEDITDTDVNYAEGEILSLKHTKNVYSVFKNAKKVVVGDGIITDGHFGLPLTDKNLSGVKKVYDGEITEMQNLKMSNFYNPNNDVIIQGNPIVDKTSETIFYVFTIDGKYYVAQQKYIDAVNKKDYVIKANSQSVAIPWTVHDGEGNLIAILCGAKPSKNADVVYGNKQTVEEILEMNRQKKEAKAAEKAEADRRNAEFEESAAQKRNAELERRKSLSTPEEINSLKEKYEGKEFTDGENTYRVIYHPDRAWFEFAIVQEDGSLKHFGAELIEPSSAAMEQKISLLEKFRQNNVKNKELARIEEEKRAEEQAKKDEEEKHINSYVSAMKPMTAAKIKNTLLKDFYADVKLHKFIENAVKNGQRLEAKDINGKKSYRLYKDGSLYYEINKTAYDYGTHLKSIMEDSEGVTEPTEIVENTYDAVSDETIEIETKMFNDIVDEVENDDTVSGKKGKHYYVSKHTPEIIVKKADIEDLPMIISFETLYLAVRENGELNGHYHGLGASNTKKLYKVLSDPTYILKNNENGRINIISDIAIGKNSKSVISIELDVYKNVEGVKETNHKGNYNLVITLFSAKDNYAENLKNKQEMSVLYEKKEDTHSSDLTSENMMLGNTEKVSSDNIIAEETKNVNTSEETITPALTDKCELHETTHTKTREALWVISLNDKITSDEYKALSTAVKKVGGYYSRFAKTPDGKAIPGFIFKSEPDADVINTFNSFFGTETTEETIPAETKSGAKEIDTEALLGAVENAKVGDEIKLADHEKAETGEQGLNNEPENDTMVSEKVKEDFKVGDIISVNGKQWRVTSTDFTMTFENLDKNDSEATFQHIGGMDSFKDTHDYTVIKESAENVHDGILRKR